MASEFRPWSPEQALAFADEVLGASKLWEPSLIAYRLVSEFQADWKIEVGCWLLEAERLGFLPQLRVRLTRASNEASAPAVVGSNDSAHRVLLSELAPAMVVYCLCRNGWEFVAWEPVVHDGDVDARLRCPHGVITDFQVKAPGCPGTIENYRIVDGERERDVLAAIAKGLKQLLATPGPQRILVVSPQFNRPMAPKTLATYLIGRPMPEDGQLVLRSSQRGVFSEPPGSSVGAVVDLSLFRGVDHTLYRCTAFINPWGLPGAAPRRDVFRAARVCALDGDRFVWLPEQPDRAFSLPNGTRYVIDEVDAGA